jgi:phage terminase large subunit GpA-like protein
VKGVGGTGKLAWPKKASKAKVGQVWLIGVDTAKEVLYQRLKRVIAPGPGYLHFDAATDEEWLEQLTSETVVHRITNGRRVRVWRPRQTGIRQEALDCTVYAWCALQGRGGAELLRRRAGRPATTTQAPAEEPEAPATLHVEPTPPPRAPQRRRGGWINGWR